jgi:hypothetical protein
VEQGIVRNGEQGRRCAGLTTDRRAQQITSPGVGHHSLSATNMRVYSVVHVSLLALEIPKVLVAWKETEPCVGMWEEISGEMLTLLRQQVRPEPMARAFSFDSSGSLTMVAYKPSIIGEQATSSYSFRFPELSQPI